MKKQLFIFFIVLSAFSSHVMSQSLVGHWTFDAGSELQDLTGNFNDLVLMGGATVTGGQLIVDPNQWANSIGYTGPALTEKTLMAWVYLEDLDVRSGSILTIDKTDVDAFDAIVYGERQPYQWMPGSSYFVRTEDPNPGYVESSFDELINLAITYEDDGGSARIRIYRDGELIGDYTKGSIESWSGSNTEIVFGARHTIGPNPVFGLIDARIEEARIYDGVLNDLQIRSINNQVMGVPTLSQWGLIILFLIILIFGIVSIKQKVLLFER